MRRGVHIAPLALGLLAGAAACAPTGPEAIRPGTEPPAYLGAETAVLDADLVNVIARMRDPGSPDTLEAYARCAAAGYASRQGFAFLRHVRTQMNEKGGVWQADAVYTMSPDLPEGVKTIDAEVVVADCDGQGIPTV